MYKEMQGSFRDVQDLGERRQKDPLPKGQWRDLPLMYSPSGLVNPSPFAEMCWMYKEMQGSVVCRDVPGLGERRQKDPLPKGQWRDLPLMYSPSGLVNPSPFAEMCWMYKDIHRCVGCAEMHVFLCMPLCRHAVMLEQCC